MKTPSYWSCLAFLGLLVGQTAGQEAAPAPAPSDPQPTLEQRLEEQARALEALREEVERLRADPAHRPTAEEVDWTERVRVGLFWIESADGDHRMSLHARVHMDARFDLASDFFDHTFQVRRARLEAQGRLFRRAEFKLGLEFGRTQGANLRDAWVKLVLLPEAQLWGGQMLLPFSTERLTSSNVMKHPERPIVIGDLLESRDVGFMLRSELWGGAVVAAAGVYNGNGQNERIDDDDDKDLAGRLEVTPLPGLLLSLNYVLSPVNRDAPAPSDVHTVGDQASLFLDYDPGVRRLGRRQRMGGGARLRRGPVQLAAEWIGSLEEELVSPQGARDDLFTWSAFVDASFVLTGEDEADSIRPLRPAWSEDQGIGPGAFELSLRYEHYQVEAEVLRHGFAVGSERADSGTVTLTWIPVEGVRAMLSYTGTAFARPVLDEGGAARWSDHVLVLRLALFF